MKKKLNVSVIIMHDIYDKCIQYLVGKPDCKRPLGRPRRIWEDNITFDLREIGWEVVD
jgi:hypothetical protein